MAYTIKPYSYQKAKLLGVVIKPSTVSGKKIDVFDKKGNKLCSIGDKNYDDFPTFKIKEGIMVAEQHKKAYHQRHAKDSKVKGSAGWYAARILW